MVKGKQKQAQSQSQQASGSLAASSGSSRVLTAFSSSSSSSGTGTLFFAQAQLAVDSDTVRVFDGRNGSYCTARWATSTSDSPARVSAIAWAELPHRAPDSTDEKATRGKKRRKSSTSGQSEPADLASSSASAPLSEKSQLVLCIGRTDGSIILLHPRQSSVLARIAHPQAATASIQSLAYCSSSSSPKAPSRLLWSCSSGGQICAWQLPAIDGTDGRLLATHEGLGLGWETIAVRCEDNKALMLVAKHAIRLLEINLPKQGESRELQTLAVTALTTYTGHASEISQLLWLVPKRASAPKTNGYTHSDVGFATCAKGDRSLNVWSVDVDVQDGVLRATTSFDDTIRCMSTPTSSDQICIVLDSGSAALVPVHAVTSNSTPPSSDKKRRRKSAVSTLDVTTTVIGPSDGRGVLDTFFQEAGTEDRSLLVASNPVKPLLQDVQVQDSVGNPLVQIDLTATSNPKGLLSNEETSQTQVSTVPLRPFDMQGHVADDRLQLSARAPYSEPMQTAVSSSAAVASEGNSASKRSSAVSHDPTLAQRLKSLQVDQTDVEANNAELDVHTKRRSGKRAKAGRLRIADVTSLSQSLVQALHSSDAKLLENCLEKTNPKIIRNTLKRVPNVLVLPLVEALVERLGRKKQGFGSGSGGVDALRGFALVEWLRHVLTIHLAYLVTVRLSALLRISCTTETPHQLPSLVSRLASLYSTMEMRVAHHNQLLALNGRLDLVVSQIDFTANPGPSQRVLAQAASKTHPPKPSTAARRYIEAEASSEASEAEEEAALPPEPVIVAPAEENGDVEDLVMEQDALVNGVGTDSDDGLDSDEEDDMPALRKAQVAKLNGFLEIEAEESDDEGSGDDVDSGRPNQEKAAFSLVNGNLGDSEDAEDEDEDLDRYESDFINDDESNGESDGDSE